MTLYFHDRKFEIEDSLYQQAVDKGCYFTQTEIDELCIHGAEDISGVQDTRGDAGLSIDDIVFSSTEEEILAFIRRGIDML
jgi:hypothetical protein